MNQHFISYYHKSLLQYLKNADILKKEQYENSQGRH